MTWRRTAILNQNVRNCAQTGRADPARRSIATENLDRNELRYRQYVQAWRLAPPMLLVADPDHFVSGRRR